MVLVLLRFFAGVLIWTVVCGFIVGSLGGSGYLWYLWWLENAILQTYLPSDRKVEILEVGVSAGCIVSCIIK